MTWSLTIDLPNTNELYQITYRCGTYTAWITSLPVVNQPVRRSAVLLDRLARRMRTSSIAALGPVGMRPRHLVALTVLRDNGGISQQELASTLQIDRTNLVGLLNELESEALVERRRSSEDRRRHVVELTATGRERLVQAELALAAVEDDVLGALSPEQREALYDLLQLAADHGADGAEPAAGC